MQYTVTAIDDFKVTVEYADKSWAEIPVNSETTKPIFEQMVRDFAPKMPSQLDFVTLGSTELPSDEPESTPEWVDPRPEWVINRLTAYGSPAEQMEFITENGLEAWQMKVAQIKIQFPKVD